MENSQIIESTVEYVKQELQDAEGGHDWWHIYRVWKNAKLMGAESSVDMMVVELGALLHDIADSKFHNGDESVGPKKAGDFMRSLALEEETIEHVLNIIKHISFKGGNFDQAFTSSELDVVQDADRLDAIGAIGVARAFSYGGYKGREFYDPSIAPNLNMTKEEYKSSTAPTINHFYEKLLLLKDRMNTPVGKRMAAQRHDFMLSFLDQFYREFEGKE